MSNETIFGKVFLGGSKRIGRLPDKVVSMLDSFIERGEHFLIGDCHGADLALQNYLHSKNYEKVTVFCSGEKCRFNVGGWEVRHIEASEELDGIEFWRKKDTAMIEECDCGFFVWDTHSIGTRLNRMDLKRLGKPIFTYRSTTDEFKITRRAK